MKLKQWADKQGIKYLTAYRWFKNGKLPVEAYQTDSGTIIVQEDESPELQMQDEKKNDSVSQILKKTVEFSKSNGSVEDFAAYILSNYKIEPQNQTVQLEKVKPRGPKPTPEMAQNHFKKFIKPVSKKPEASMFLVEKDALDTIVTAGTASSSYSEEESFAKELSSVFDPSGNTKVGTVIPSFEMQSGSFALNQSLTNGFNAAMHNPLLRSSVKTYAGVEGSSVFTRTVDDMSSFSINTSVSSTGYLPVMTNSNALGTGIATAVFDVGTQSRNLSDIAAGQRLNKIASLDEDNCNDLEDDRNDLEDFYQPSHSPVTYDEGRYLVQLMVDCGFLSDDVIVMDRQAKNICSWSRETYNVMVNSSKEQLAKKI